MTTAWSCHDDAERAVREAFEVLAAKHEGSSVEYADGYYIVFADGSSLSAAVTALDGDA